MIPRDDPDLAQLMAALPEARVVGGAVRDALLGFPVADIDLATPAPPARVIAALGEAGLRAIPTGLAHGTVTALSGTRAFEVTTLRRDVATDGRHALVAFTSDWAEDAARRDFTINAMSMDAAGEVFDYFDGRADLAAGRLRFVGDPAQRIAEDYLRTLRFFRFHARYGRSPPDPEALAAIRAAVPGLARLSPERIWAELRRILAGPAADATLALMERQGVLPAVLPGSVLPARPIDALPPDPVQRLAALIGGDADDVADRLRLSNPDRARLAALLSGPVPHPGDDPAALRRLLADTPADMLIGRAWLAGGAALDWSALRARLAAMPRPRFPLAGRDVLALGVSPGPRVGALLEAVRRWWAAGGCVADATACAERMRELIANPCEPG